MSSSEDDMMEPPEQAWLQVPSKLENRQVLDCMPMAGKNFHAIVLSDGNAIAVFDIAKRAVVFKAKYADATDNITKLFSLNSLPISVKSASLSQQATESQQIDSKTLDGYILLVETKLV